MFYEIGLFAADRPNKMRADLKKGTFVLSAALLSLLISMLEANILSSRYNAPAFATFAIKYSSFLYSVCVILGFIYFREYFGRMPRLLGIIGYYSLGIYLINIIVLHQVVNVFKKFDVICSFQPLYQLILTLTTLLICYFIIYAARKLLPEYLCSKILGF
jgi:surface polysaccharide O-acyltransferase-like enzyme